MKCPPLVILGYSEAAMFLRASSAQNVEAIISIHGQRELGVEAIIAHRLDLCFDDVEAAEANDAMAMHRAMSRRQWAEQNALTETAPTRAHAAAIIEFARSIRHLDGIVLCHCAGGVSRSPAAALICLCAWHGDGTEAHCVAEVQRIRPVSIPHLGLTRIADELLGRGGKLVSAVAEMRARLQAHDATDLAMRKRGPFAILLFAIIVVIAAWRFVGCPQPDALARNILESTQGGRTRPPFVRNEKEQRFGSKRAWQQSEFA